LTSIRRDFGTARLWQSLAVNFFAAVGFAASAIGLWAAFGPGAVQDFRDPLIGITLGGSAIYSGARSWPRPVAQHYNSANVDIRIIEGDLFDQKQNLVVGFADTFDTVVPIIAKTSVQGQFLDRVFGGDVQRLDNALSGPLTGITPVESVVKQGKTLRYPLGTVAAIQEGPRYYFCVAYTKMSNQNVAQGTIDGIWRSLLNVWDSVRQNANGEPISIPVLGGGLARLAQILPAQDSIRFIILSFVFACRGGARVCERLDIVVRKEDVQNLDMPEIQAFLKSLKAS